MHAGLPFDQNASTMHTVFSIFHTFILSVHSYALPHTVWQEIASCGLSWQRKWLGFSLLGLQSNIDEEILRTDIQLVMQWDVRESSNHTLL